MMGEAVLDAVRAQCLTRGLGGLKGLAVLFRRMDTDFNKALSWEEFHKGMKQYGIEMDDNNLRVLFSQFDTNSKGHVDFREFLTKLQPRMSAQRIAVVNEAFDKMDVVKDGVLDINDMKIAYKQHAKQHPKYIDGSWTLEQVMQDFLNAFDSKDTPDGVVTREEFHQYYAAVSVQVDDDSYFDMTMRTAWGLPARKISRIK